MIGFHDKTHPLPAVDDNAFLLHDLSGQKLPTYTGCWCYGAKSWYQKLKGAFRGNGSLNGQGALHHGKP